jgi:hypothetical protein|tara:strand:- start:2793 stop:2990 length:198 start_codon:yes stop_codon:yes gene_type:complete
MAVKSSTVVTLFGADYGPTEWLDPYLSRKKAYLKTLQKNELHAKQAQVKALQKQIELLKKQIEGD